MVITPLALKERQFFVHYSTSELQEIFGSVGDDVRIDRSCVVIGGKRINIGSHVRIDCFSLLSAGELGISIGNHVHIAAGCYLFGSGGKIQIGDFAGISARSLLYTATDDYVRGHLTGPTVPHKYRKVAVGDVVLGKHCIIGCGSVIMTCTLGLASAVGALSFVNKDVVDFDIVVGVPAVKRSSRDHRILELEAQLIEEEARVPNS